MPTHGDVRNHRTETHDGKPVEYVDALSGKTVYHGPGSSWTFTVSEKYCARCERWIEVRGVVGAIEFIAYHDHGEAK